MDHRRTAREGQQLAYTLVGAVFVVVGNFVADIALTVADPRVRLA